jgi:hypothetical protein
LVFWSSAETWLIEQLEFFADFTAQRDEPAQLAQRDVLQSVEPVAALRAVGEQGPILLVAHEMIRGTRRILSESWPQQADRQHGCDTELEEQSHPATMWRGWSATRSLDADACLTNWRQNSVRCSLAIQALREKQRSPTDIALAFWNAFIALIQSCFCGLNDSPFYEAKCKFAAQPAPRCEPDPQPRERLHEAGVG